VTVVPVEPVVPVTVVSAVLVTVDWDVAVDGSGNYWHHWYHRHNSYSDHWNNGKYHRAIDSYISIKHDKHSRNNCHSIYWHHGHNCHSDYRSNRKYHRAVTVD
jgi:hypothetical protein